MRNFQQLKGGDLLVQTISKYIDLKRDGSEYRACCPFHHENKPSFTVVPDKNFYHCHGCGAHGDAVDFVEAIESVDKKTAYSIVAGDYDPTEHRPVKTSVQKSDAYAGITPKDPPDWIQPNEPIKIYNPKRDKLSEVTPTMVFPYLGIGFVIRLEINGDKLTPFVRWCESKVHTGWTYYPAPEPRPMYNAHKIEPGDRILVTEGEKAADAAEILLGHAYTVITWPYGAKAVQKADWSCVKGHDVLLWPDMDEQGLQAMIGAHTDSQEKKGAGDLALDAGALSVRYINWDRSKPKGWDAADALEEGLTKQQVIAWAREYARDFIAQDEPLPPEGEGEENLQYYYEYEQEQSNVNVIQHPIMKQWDLALVRGQNGVLVNKHNAAVYLEHHPDMHGVMAYNEFDGQVYIMRRPPWDDNESRIPRRIEDHDGTAASCWLDTHAQSSYVNTVHQLMVMIAQKRRFDPLKTYLKSVKWDGTPRIDTWLCKYMGVDDTPGQRAIGRKFMVGAAARGLRPGCKMDNMLILEGSQGKRKSTAVRELFGADWFTDEVYAFHNAAEFGLSIQGRWGVEVAELSAMRKSDTNAVKKALSQQEDHYRPPYGRVVIHRPRRCVFIGTLNEDSSYLPDTTGNRRYWPVTVRNVDIDGITRDRDQLWAEAVVCLQDNERWWFDYDQDRELLNEVEQNQEIRQEEDSWHELIEENCYAATSLTYDEIYRKLGIEPDKRNKVTDTRIRTIMKKLGWEFTRVKQGKRVVRAWRNKNMNSLEF